MDYPNMKKKMEFANKIEDGKCKYCGEDIPNDLQSWKFCCEEHVKYFHNEEFPPFSDIESKLEFQMMSKRRVILICQDCKHPVGMHGKEGCQVGGKSFEKKKTE